MNTLNTHIVIAFDEFPYLYVRNNNDELDSLFQNLLANYTKNINIILSGSNIGMMKALIQNKNPLYGRFKTIINLKEFDYLSASEFYPHLSNYDKVAFYSVFGGSPYILRQLDENKSLRDNICMTFLNNLSSVYNYASQNYTSDLSSKSNYETIFKLIGNGKVKYRQLENELEYKQNGLLNKQLNNLIEMEFIEANSPINRINDNKKVSYSLLNNALRFYYGYIYGKENIINILGKEVFYETYIEKSINTFISFRFEDIVKQYISHLIKNKSLRGIYNLGTYYYDDPKNKKNGEFDIAIKTNDGYDIIEVKYLQTKLNDELIRKEIEKIKEIKEIDIKGFGFASINGFLTDKIKMKYRFDGDDIYFKK